MKILSKICLFSICLQMANSNEDGCNHTVFKDLKIEPFIYTESEELMMGINLTFSEHDEKLLENSTIVLFSNPHFDSVRVDNFSLPYYEIKNSTINFKPTGNYTIEIMSDYGNCAQTHHFQIPVCVDNVCCDSNKAPFVIERIEPVIKQPHLYNVTWSGVIDQNITLSNLFYYYHLVNDENSKFPVTFEDDDPHLIEMNLSEGHTYVIKMNFVENNLCSYTTYFEYTEPRKYSLYIISTITGILIVLILLMLYKNWQGLALCMKTVEEMDHDVIPEKVHLKKEAKNMLYVSYECKQKLIEDSYELPRNLIHLETEIGHGTFGKVFKGTLIIQKDQESRTVAVKQVKDNKDESLLEDFRQEIDLMKKICSHGNHENVVKFYGCCSKDLPRLIVLEYLPCGNLKSYLEDLNKSWIYRKRKQTFFPPEMDIPVLKELSTTGTGNLDSPGINSLKPLLTPDSLISARKSSFSTESRVTEISYVKTPPSVACLELSEKELYNFALQIAKGMEFLEKIPITHRDLAARNILLTQNKTLKISDFGLSRMGPYTSKKSSPLPLRWMSIEAILQSTYSNKSDVWSFGVVLWEIGTLGGFPYGGIQAEALLPRLLNGERLSRPEICSEQIYKLMLECWEQNPDDRPSFQQIVLRLPEYEKPYSTEHIPVAK
ncbi:fibroblast growth factor receptor-like [Aethina tumida]|uniref:fibroblast growth factor receptor-like n=1 Tax=Aethina tumida TaxID=116153 RepID=UPI002148F7E4|nr:fibroblast growth factor receptor-like [Aethina tumida]